MSLLVLSASDVTHLTRELSVLTLCDMLGSSMRAVSSASDGMEAVPLIQNPQRIATESNLHKTLYMPSRLTTAAQGSATSIKVVAVPKPECPVPGLPASTLLLDESTGGIRAIVNAAELTGLRTAAASALATKILADPQSEILVIFGSGTQAFHHARLVLQLMPSVKEVHFVVRRTSARSNAVLQHIASEFPHVKTFVTTDTIVLRRADVICTCVPSTTPLFACSDLKTGVHINAIGSYQRSMLDFPPSLISPTSTVGDSEPKIPTILVDSREACLNEAGELIAARIEKRNLIEIGELCKEDGTLREDAATEEKLSRLRAGPGRRSLFKCVGVGAMDVAVTKLVVDEAIKQGRGTLVDF